MPQPILVHSTQQATGSSDVGRKQRLRRWSLLVALALLTLACAIVLWLVGNKPSYHFLERARYVGPFEYTGYYMGKTAMTLVSDSYLLNEPYTQVASRARRELKGQGFREWTVKAAPETIFFSGPNRSVVISALSSDSLGASMPGINWAEKSKWTTVDVRRNEPEFVQRVRGWIRTGT